MSFGGKGLIASGAEERMELELELWRDMMRFSALRRRSIEGRAEQRMASELGSNMIRDMIRDMMSYHRVPT